MLSVFLNFFFFNKNRIIFQAGFEGDRRDKILRTYVRNAYSYHLSEIFFTIVNEYTDWERTVLHPINTRDATIAALSDAQYVAPLVHSGDMLSQPRSSTSSAAAAATAADDRKERTTKSFFYVFDYQTRDGDYPQVSYLATTEYTLRSRQKSKRENQNHKTTLLETSCCHHKHYSPNNRNRDFVFEIKKMLNAPAETFFLV